MSQKGEESDEEKQQEVQEVEEEEKEETITIQKAIKNVLKKSLYIDG